MCKKALFFLIATLIVTGIAEAAIIYVPNDFNTIQGAIDATEDGDTVLIQRGVYFENIDFDGHNIVVGSLFVLTGMEDYINTTIIDGDSTGSVVTFENEESQDAALIGLTIRNGSGSLWVDPNRQYCYVGGGIRCIEASPVISRCLIYNNSIAEERSYGGGTYCYDSHAIISNCTILGNSCVDGSGIWCGDDVTITECDISDNSAGGYGGGICANSAIITNCSIENNTASSGGGISAYSTRIINCFIKNNTAGSGGGIQSNDYSTISECTITGNSAETNGGGIFCLNSDANINNCVIHSNEARSGGGIACTHWSDPEITGCLIYENTASRDGGGIYCWDRANITITNCTVTRNETEIGGGIFCGALSSPIITNSIFRSNSPQEIYFAEDAGDIVLSVSYSDISGGEDGIVTNDNGIIDWRRGNIDEDPLFVNVDEDDYHLAEGSPCIDVGDPHSDLDPDSTRADMGALYYDHDNAVYETEGSSLPAQFLISSIYPNPFNSSVTIKYSLPIPSHVSLEVYNTQGRRMTTLFKGQQTAGFHTINLNAGDLPSGLYFVRLNASGNVFTQKVMLIR
jgi:parallel beta-helix repeat protein/predicted outer membrane repeat protein